jgi:hypothetical protein
VLGGDAHPFAAAMVRWKLMSSKLSGVRLTATAAMCSALLVTGPSALAAPATDSQGYVNSTARCPTPATAVVFGSTETSRVAICESPDGQYEYRGVRLRDGAKLIVAAKASGDGSFVADNHGIGYLLTAKSLVVSVGERVIREESFVDLHRPGAPTTTAPPAPLPPPLPAEVGGGG